MMQGWGNRHVSSAHEVYLLLCKHPATLEDEKSREDLLSIEPPIWGSNGASACAQLVASCGYRVWSWDELGIVYSYPDAVPPRSLRYLSWRTAREAPKHKDKPP